MDANQSLLACPRCSRVGDSSKQLQFESGAETILIVTEPQNIVPEELEQASQTNAH